MSTHILHIDASIFGEGGVSSQLTQSLISALKVGHNEVDITHRKLNEGAIPHLSTNTIEAISAGKTSLSDTLINELKRADILVLGVPMYNFGVPSEFKAWIDHVVHAGLTFRYTENGPIGLLQNKKVYVVTTRGGVYKDSDKDLEVPYLTTILGFIGLTDVEYIYAEGLNLGEREREDSIAGAQAAIKDIEKNMESV